LGGAASAAAPKQPAATIAEGSPMRRMQVFETMALSPLKGPGRRLNVPIY
jgi:hypothetical protein